MITSKFTKIAAVAALSFGLVAMGANESHAGSKEELLIGSLLGGAAGAGAGFAFGKGKGAAIGGILGLAAGALASTQFSNGGLFADQEPVPAYTGYAPPPPAYQPPPVAYQAPVAVQPTTVDPYATYQNATYQTVGYSQAVCRPYNTTIRIDGQRQAITGTACQQADGTWRVVN